MTLKEYVKTVSKNKNLYVRLLNSKVVRSIKENGVTNQDNLTYFENCIIVRREYNKFGIPILILETN